MTLDHEKLEEVRINVGVILSKIESMDTTLEKHGKDITRLNSYMQHGKALGTVIAMLVTCAAALGALWDWVVSHIKVH